MICKGVSNISCAHDCAYLRSTSLDVCILFSMSHTKQDILYFLTHIPITVREIIILILRIWNRRISYDVFFFNSLWWYIAVCLLRTIRFHCKLYPSARWIMRYFEFNDLIKLFNANYLLLTCNCFRRMGSFLAIYSACDSRPMLLLRVIVPSIIVKKVYKRSGDTILANLTLLPAPVFSL